MKKSYLLLLIMIFTLSCTGCSRSYWYKPQENIGVNYNNISATDNYTFWMTNESFFDLDTFIYSNSYHVITKSGRKEIPSAKEGFAAHIQVYGNMVYMLDHLEGSVCWFHSYDLDTGTHTTLDTVCDVNSYFVVDRHIYYTRLYSVDDEWFQPLYIYSLDNQTTTQIAESILKAGGIDGKPVYLIHDVDTFSIYSYDAVGENSIFIDKFTYTLAEDEYIEDYVNFTADYVILTTTNDVASKVLCYHLGENQVKEYQMDGETWSVVAYDDYAFVIVEDTVDSSRNVLFRMRLQDGKIDTIATIQGLIYSFVASDDCIYIVIDPDYHHVYRYDVDGSKELVCRR